MKLRLPALRVSLREGLPSFRDLHVYGGAGVAAVGLGLWIAPGAALVAFGVFLLVLGLFYVPAGG